ncbi:MAG: NHL repeat-containing protein [Actinomycetota bacterium]|nr:NHL repeat-containing protein [Actinomycetota bacterium]
MRRRIDLLKSHGAGADTSTMGAARRVAAIGGLTLALVASLLAGLPAGAAGAPVPGRITTFAGGLGYGPATDVAQRARGLAAHGSTLYVVDGTLLRAVDLTTGLERVVNVDPLRNARTPTSPGDFPPLWPTDVGLDRAGNVHLVGNNRVGRLDASGEILPVLGSGEFGFSPEGTPALETKGVQDFAFGPSGTLYFEDTYRVRKVDASGRIVTIAGGGEAFGHGIPATQAAINPFSITVDANENVYVLNGGHTVHRIDPAGMIWYVAGDHAEWPPCGDNCPAVDAHVDPTAVAVTPAGDVIITDGRNHRVRKVNTAGIISTLAGTGTQGHSGDGGAAVLAQLWDPWVVATDAAGHVYFEDSHRIRRVTPAGVISTFAGNGTESYGGDGRAAVSAQLGELGGIAVDRSGNVYIVDAGNLRIRKVDSRGVITTVAGTGEVIPGTNRGGFAGDGGPATAARIDPDACPGIVVDASGGVIFSDLGNRRVRRIAPDGTISTVAGSGEANWDSDDLGDGRPATQAVLRSPCGLALDAAGNLYIADTLTHRVRKVDASGTIRAFAGSGPVDGSGFYSGDGGPARSAQLSYPTALAFDSAGRLHVADIGNNLIRRIDGQGTITTVAGRYGISEPGEGGPATQAGLASPGGVTFDGAGNLYIAEYEANRVRRVTPAGVITTVAGSGRSGLGDGGPATQAELTLSGGLAVDPAGNLYVNEASMRVRRIEAIASYMSAGPTTTTSVAPATTTTTARRTTTTAPPPPANVTLQSPYSVWSQPAATPLDGIGTWIVPLNEPAARAGQLPPSYLYAHAFSFAASTATGVVGLSTGPAGKFALFSVKGPDAKSYDAVIPFTWKAGQFYFPLVQQVRPGVWVALVYDYSAAKWIPIGQLTLPSAWGKLAPTTVTIAAWAGGTATNCASYPRADLFVYPTIGYAAGTTATLSSGSAGAGPCAAQVSTEGGWMRYQVGAA